MSGFTLKSPNISCSHRSMKLCFWKKGNYLSLDKVIISVFYFLSWSPTAVPKSLLQNFKRRFSGAHCDFTWNIFYNPYFISKLGKYKKTLSNGSYDARLQIIHWLWHTPRNLNSLFLIQTDTTRNRTEWHPDVLIL